MFAPRREVLKAKSGTLADTPLPLLMHALLVQEQSVVLELKLRNLEKRVFFENGVPIGCDSNLMHETLGHSLIEKKKLTAEQHRQLLAESAASERPLQTLLVEKQLISGFELFKHLQASLGRTVLDAFRWSGATWRILPAEDLDTPIRMNAVQLIYVGCMQLPLAALAAHLALEESEQLAFLPDAPDVSEELKLAPRDARLVQGLKKRLTLGELSRTQGFTAEEVHRKLYALRVLEFIDSAKAVDAQPVRSRGSQITASPLPAVPPKAEGLPFLDADEATQNLLASEFLSFRGKDSFELLGVGVDVQGAPLQRAFLAKSSALSPLRFQNAETRGKAEVLFAAYARAFGALADFDTWQVHCDRRAARNAKKPDALKAKRAAEAFRIRTDLLDADAQFEEGRKRLAASNPKGAIEYFQQAIDIEPRPRFSAWLAWAKYQSDPQHELQNTLSELTQVCAQDANCEEAWVWRGDLSTAVSRHADAEESYRKAYKLNPNNKRYVELIKSAASMLSKK